MNKVNAVKSAIKTVLNAVQARLFRHARNVFRCLYRCLSALIFSAIR